MTGRNRGIVWKPVAAVLIVAATCVAWYAILRLETLTGLPESYQLDLTRHWQIDESLIGYEQVAEVPLQLSGARAIAVGPEERIYVAGDNAVHIYEPDGQMARALPLVGPPQCLAVGGSDHAAPGRVYVGVQGRLEVFDATGQKVSVWDGWGDSAVLTSIAVSEEDIFVADAAGRRVLRIDPSGAVVAQIGDPAAGSGAGGFIIPSPYFDVVNDPNGLLYVVNPGARRVETYTWDGHLEATWGSVGSEVADFFGCCNPAHLACLPEGQFITSEKGVPRIKCYSREGEFQCVVAGPQQLNVRPTAAGDPRSEQEEPVFDVATDGQGRVLVLDPIAKSIRVFVRKPPAAGRQDADE